MEKDKIHAFWNYSRILATFPKEAFLKDPMAIRLASQYDELAKEYFQFFNEVNAPQIPDDENGK